ncbi:MAG TPA: hypothetical protein VGS79_19910 [Puia sp.]|nr:hypothetical protein [Puia sp.]
MKITPLAGLLWLCLPLLGLPSCKMTETTTAVFPPMVTLNEIDTLILLRPTDDRPPPDGLYLTCRLRLGNCITTGSYDSLLRRIRQLAIRKRGNVAVVKEASMYITRVDVYSLPVPLLGSYITLLDSLQHAYDESIKNIAVVYLVDQDDYYSKVFFNDSLVARPKGTGFDGLRAAGKTTLTFDRPGILRIKDAGTLDIRLGREYYILLYNNIGRHNISYHYAVIDRDRFVIEDLRFFGPLVTPTASPPAAHPRSPAPSR